NDDDVFHVLSKVSQKIKSYPARTVSHQKAAKLAPPAAAA
ncbi:MAG: hypothetical protein ACI9M6_001114, partial [Hydrogenophaga sp.]